MSITDELIALDPTLEHHNEGHWKEPYQEQFGGFSSFNDAGIECETGEFLYALVRLLKPSTVLETGTHWGVGASYIGLALRDNAQGILDTIEFIPEIHERAKERVRVMGIQSHVICHLGDVRAFQPPVESYGMILLDTEPQTRFQELVRFYPYLAPGGFIFIHDLHRHMHQIPNEEHGFAWPYGPVPEDMRNLVKDGFLRPFHFSTPRGLTGFYKVSPEDYRWL